MTTFDIKTEKPTFITIVIITQYVVIFKKTLEIIKCSKESILIFHLFCAIMSVKILLMAYLVAESEEKLWP